MSLDPAFVADCPFGPDGIVVDELYEVDVEAGRLRASMRTHADLPITRAQRTHPVRHPAHVSGGLMVHVTGILGFMHAYYVLGLRHADGWVGFGGKIYTARFASLGELGPPLQLEIQSTKVRKLSDKIFGRYNFRFEQEDRLVYASDQSAMWIKTTP